MHSFIKKAMLVVGICLVVSCGGGSGSEASENITTSPVVLSTSESASASASTPVPVSTSIPEQIPVSTIKTETLKSEAGFLFNSSEKLKLIIDFTEAKEIPDRITLCKPGETESSQSNDCVFSGVIHDDRFEKEFLVANDTDSFVMVLWFLKGEFKRTVYTWDRAQGNDWLIVL